MPNANFTLYNKFYDLGISYYVSYFVSSFSTGEWALDLKGAK